MVVMVVLETYNVEVTPFEFVDTYGQRSSTIAVTGSLVIVVGSGNDIGGSTNVHGGWHHTVCSPSSYTLGSIYNARSATSAIIWVITI